MTANLHNRPLKTLYVYLLDEGVDVWRPTEAIDLGDGLYELLPTPDYDPEDEVWEFLPGTIVRVENKKLYNGIFPVATKA